MPTSIATLGRSATLAALALAITGADRAASAAERLVLLGGGPRPEAALSRFVEWAGGSHGSVLIVPWASSEPAESAASFREDLEPHHPGRVDVAPLAPLDEAQKAALLARIAEAGGVFFTGGDQARIMDVLRDEVLLRAFRARYRAGAVFGGRAPARPSCRRA